MRRLEVLVIGAGFSGICAAVKLKQAGIDAFEVIDKNTGLGGTWWANTYPGATCDIPSHFYSFSFAPNPNWSHLYSPQPEIQAYMEDVVDRFAVRDHFTFGREAAGARYDAEAKGWIVNVDGEEIFARFLINAMGGLHKPAWPDIPGREDFAGPSMHTAEWDPDFDPDGKRIAVIGSAASAIQVVPEIAKVAARVDLYQRTPNYISVRGDYAYSDAQKARFARIPFWWQTYRWLIRKRLDLVLYPSIQSAEKRKTMRDRITGYMRKVVKDPALHDKLAPDYEVGCKRILISDDFYASLNRDNVDLITDPIARITAGRVETADGSQRPVDAIVFATGFDIQSQYLALDLAGPDGVRLRDLWADKVEAYKGVMVAGFPNYFMTTGPNTGVGTTSVVYMIEQTVPWILRAMKSAGKDGTVDVRAEAQDAFNARIHEGLSNTVWATGCHSWYKRPDGRIETLYPGNAAAYVREMRSLPRGELLFG